MKETHLFSASEKVELYSLAKRLFNEGKSYPQVIEELEKFCEPNYSNLIAEKGLNEEWDSLFEFARQLYGQGKTYAEVIEVLKEKESDNDIVKFAADVWYEVKNIEVENEIEGSTNILDGIKWVIICGLGIIFSFGMGLSLFAKILWMVAFIGSLLQYLFGIFQKKLARKVKKVIDDKQN